MTPESPYEPLVVSRDFSPTVNLPIIP